MYNRGTKYLQKGNYEKALQFFKKEKGEFKELYLNLGNTYRALDQHARALACYEKANDPSTISVETGKGGEYALALNNIGLMYYGSGDDKTAISYYTRALALNPRYQDAIWNYANAVLRDSNCQVGWEMYEKRFTRESGAVPLDRTLPMWDGGAVGSICVLTEQGIGDKIMFGRYIQYLKNFASRVVVQCHPSLDEIYCDYETCRDAASSGCEVGVPICSLAGYFGIKPENWLDGKFNAKEFDRAKLNIGVVWHGSITHVNNWNRSCHSSYFSALARYGNVYSLAPDSPTARGITALEPKTWGETASTILGLDVVVTVDTSIVHLCGTLGVPCIMIQPKRETDFRWGQPGATNAWYKSVIVVPNSNWDDGFARVHELMGKLKEDHDYRRMIGMTKTELEAAVLKEQNV